MIVKKYYKIEDLKDKINNLYIKNKNSPYTCSYEYIKNTIKNVKYLHLRYATKYVFFEVIDKQSNETILLFLVEELKKHYKVISSFDSCDLIYNEKYSKEKISSALMQILNNVDKEVLFEYVIDDSLLCKILLNSKNTVIIQEKDCGRINFTNDYNEYYNSLSKSSRQNLRTAYNRLKTDDVSFDTINYEGVSSSRVYKKLRKYYTARWKEKNTNKSFLKLLFVKLYEPVSKVIAKSSDGFNFILTINNKIAAFMSGFLDKKNNKILIPRLVYNSKYSRYSPGILLINETIKFLQQNNMCSCLDLGIGDENYKFVMGAKEYKAFVLKYKGSCVKNI
jgi:hypothetical protein